ncbi:hypothetical protein [Nonomuraea composti]|nr:hypothetical protein [Nonomuraea sp. FMUSA5-5]
MDLDTGDQVCPPLTGHAVAATPRGHVVVCFDRDIAVCTATPPS